MQPLRPKLKKVMLTGFVACMSLFGVSSGAPVSRTTRTAEAPASTTLPASSSPSNAATSSPSPSRQTGSVSNHGTDSASPAPSVAPPRRSSFSLGLNLGQIDYAAAGIARRVSRIFVKRMSSQTARSAQTEPEEDRGTLVPVEETSLLNSESAHQGPKDEGEAKDSVEMKGEDRDMGEHFAEPGDSEATSPEVRACRWGCF